MSKNLFNIREFKRDIASGVLCGILLAYLVHSTHMLFVLWLIVDIALLVSSNTTGFLLLALVMLLVFPENNKLKFMRMHSVYKHVFSYFVFTIFLFVLLLLLSAGFILLRYFLPVEFAYIVLVIFVISVFALLRCIWLLKKTAALYVRRVRK